MLPSLAAVLGAAPKRARTGGRWVQRYAPEVNRRLGSRLKPTNDSWRVDETYIRVKGQWRYL